MGGVVGKRPLRTTRVLLLLRDLLGFCRIHNPAMRSHASVHGLLFVCLFVSVCVSLLEPSGSLMIGRHQILCEV